MFKFRGKYITLKRPDHKEIMFFFIIFLLKARKIIILWLLIFKRIIINLQEFRGPYSSSEESLQLLPQPMEARHVRIQPTSWDGSISLRFEVIGCILATVTTPMSKSSYT